MSEFSGHPMVAQDGGDAAAEGSAGPALRVVRECRRRAGSRTGGGPKWHLDVARVARGRPGPYVGT
jgi:hypothetical protein